MENSSDLAFEVAQKGIIESLTPLHYFILACTLLVIGLMIFIGTYPTEGEEAAFEAAKMEAAGIMDSRPVVLPSEDDLTKMPSFTPDDLNQYRTGKTVYVGIKGLVFDVSGKDVYMEGGGYSVFAGKDASCALAKMNF